MNNASTYEQLEPAQLVDVILTQSDIVRLGPDIGAVMSLVTERAVLLTSGDGAAIELLEGDDMVYRATSGIAWAQLGLRLKANSSLSGYCVQHDEVVNCPDVERDARVDQAACRKIGLRSMIVIPLKHDGVVVGVLKVMSRLANAFGTHEQLVLELLGEVVASVMFHVGRQGEEDLRKLITRDPLTGLPNRALLYDLLRKRCAEATRHNERFGVLRLSLREFYDLRSSAGRKTADTVLKEVARRLDEVMRDGDTVAHTGESEFAVILNRIGSAEELPLAVERYRQCLQAPFALDGHSLDVAAVLGAALFPDQGKGAEELLEQARPVSGTASAAGTTGAD